MLLSMNQKQPDTSQSIDLFCNQAPFFALIVVPALLHDFSENTIKMSTSVQQLLSMNSSAYAES